THPDESVDLAVLKIGIDGGWDHVAWPISLAITDDQIDAPGQGDRKVELGDEVFFTGLFHPHCGEGKNIPIVRIGNVAALREEPVLNPDGRPADLYLAESRSIGGLSGSPVFMDVLTAKRVLQPTY